jgi:hypothetical protein
MRHYSCQFNRVWVQSWAMTVVLCCIVFCGSVVIWLHILMPVVEIPMKVCCSCRLGVYIVSIHIWPMPRSPAFNESVVFGGFFTTHFTINSPHEFQ